MKRADRQRLAAVLADLRQWLFTVAEVRYLSWHLPVSVPTRLDGADEALVALIESAAADLDEASRLARASCFPGRKSLQPAIDAAERLAALHSEFTSSERDTALRKVRDDYAERGQSEREHLSTLLAALARSARRAKQTLQNLQHLPLTRQGVLPATDITRMTSLVQVVELHEGPAHRMVEQSWCTAGTCREAHSSATLLAALYAEASATKELERIGSLADVIRARLESEQSAVRTLFQQVSALAASH